MASAHVGRPTTSYRVEVALTPGGPWRLADYVHGTYRAAVQRARDASPARFRVLTGSKVIAEAERKGDRYVWSKGGWSWQA
jgi:hypothetical protein